MTLDELEAADKVIRHCRFTASPLSEWWHLSPLPLSKMQCELVQQLLKDDQFYVLLDLKRAEAHALRALERISMTPAVEYLREDLETHLLGLQSLLVKVEVEEALRRDRTVLTTRPPEPDEQGENHGLLAELRAVPLSGDGGGGDVLRLAESVEEPGQAGDSEGGGRGT